MVVSSAFSILYLYIYEPFLSDDPHVQATIRTILVRNTFLHYSDCYHGLESSSSDTGKNNQTICLS